jgi:hypothetical protein
MYQLKIIGKIQACGRFVVKQVEWILATGFWNDIGVWDDRQSWID